MGGNNSATSTESIEGLFVDHFNGEGSTLGFMAREKPDYTNFEDNLNRSLYDLMIKRDKNKVEILRPLWFFHEGQKGITLGKLREYYTEKAIALFEKDEYIKVAENESAGLEKGEIK